MGGYSITLTAGGKVLGSGEWGVGSGEWDGGLRLAASRMAGVFR